MGHTSDTLATVRGGAASRAADELLKAVVEAVQKTGKKGSVGIKLEISMLKDGDTEMEVKVKLSHSVPVADIPMGIYYPGKDFTLEREDPRQLTFDGEMSGDGKTVNLAARRVGASGDDI